MERRERGGREGRKIKKRMDIPPTLLLLDFFCFFPDFFLFLSYKVRLDRNSKRHIEPLIYLVCEITSNHSHLEQ